jgi:hypothetical protein
LHLKINNDNIPVFSNQIENGKIENFNHIQVKDFSHNEHGEKSHEQQVSSKQTVILSFSSSNPNSNTFDNILFNINTSFLLSSPQSPHLNSASASQFRTIDIGISDGIKFTLFNKLPTELRLKIWRYAASQLPQIIGVKDIENKEELCGTKARCPLLLTCTEARNEVLKRKVDFNSPYVPCSRTRFDVKDFIEAKAPKIHTNLEVDTLYLMIFRQSIYDRDLPKLWTKLLSGPKEKIRRLAISYTLYKRRWDHMNAMVLKLDLEVLVLVVDAEEISDGDVPTFVMPRSKVGRRSEFWRTWEGLKSSERRNLVNYKEHYERFWKNMVLRKCYLLLPS